MSIRARSPIAAAVLVAGAVLLVPSVATADTPSGDAGELSCSALLEQSAAFPGAMATDDGEIRLVSDSYVSFLTRQPECAPAGT